MQPGTGTRFMRLGLGLAVYLLGGAPGCGAGESDLVVTVGGIPTRAAQVVMTATLDGKLAANNQVIMAPTLTPPQNRFAVELASEISGSLGLSVQALDSDSCVQASGMTAVSLPSGRKDLDLPLVAQTPRKCGGLAPCAAKTLCSTSDPANQTIQSIWPISASDIWAVGNGVTLLHFDGASWTVRPAPVGATGNLNGVWASATDNVWAVGDAGLILHYDGKNWATVASPATLRLWAVWGITPSDIWAVGDAATTTSQGTALHYDGTRWLAVTNGGLGMGQINSVWAASSNFVYICGVGGLLARYDGTTWFTIDGGTTVNLHAIWGTPGGINESVVFAAGDNGNIFRIRYALDTQWARLPTTGTGSTLYGIHGDGTSVVYAVGSSGTVVRADPPFDTFAAQGNTALSTLFSVRAAGNGLAWAGGGGGYLGFLDFRP